MSRQAPLTCKSVKCMIIGCQQLASHKVEEVNPWIKNDLDESDLHDKFESIHNLTTYLCEAHFEFVMTREENYKMKDNRYENKT